MSAEQLRGTNELRQAYDELTDEGNQLAGRLTQLAQRATVYHHIYRASGGNHVFPLIAAHGALWAGGYFKYGLKLGRWLSWQYGLTPALRRQRLSQLDAFADAFREINRLVCVDTYRNFHFMARYRRHPGASEFLSPRLFESLDHLHAACEAGRTLTETEKQELFLAHFLNEQETVVSPRITAAIEQFDWPLLKFIALRPTIRFAYFPNGRSLRFGDFSQVDQRIANGQQAFSLGSAIGWDVVERALRQYALLPEALFADPAEHFATMRQKWLYSGNSSSAACLP